MIGVGIAIAPGMGARGAAPVPPAAPITAVAADGWQATYDGAPPPEMDPVASPESFTVSRAGFDAAGAPVTVADPVTLMKRVRLPYPNQASLTTDSVALSDFVYAGETVPGAVNNSMLSYPKPVAMWLAHDYDRATGQSYTARLAVAHRHARSGRPVAAVKFTATDGTTTVESTVSALSTISYTASGLTVPHFAASLDFSTLNDDAIITIDAVIYPWVGDSYTASVDGATQPSISFSTLRVLNDVTYGTAYAYVATTGNDGTGTVSATAATAEASPFLTVAAAASAIQTFNNSNYSRNNASGGIIRLEPGTYTHSSFSSVAVADIPLEIEAADGSAAKATTIYQDAGSSVSNGCPDKLKFRNITLQRNTASSVIFLDSGAGLGSSNLMAFENCHFEENGHGNPWGAWIYKPGRVWMTECTADTAGYVTPFSTVNKAINLIGCAMPTDNAVFNAVGCKALSGKLIPHRAATGELEASRGTFVGWCFLSSNATSVKVVESTATIDANGFALVGNVLEDQDGTTSANTSLMADSNTNPCQNVIIQCNTVVGERFNFVYQDSGTTTIAKTGELRFNAIWEYNTKSDVFGTNGNLTGNWPVIYKVGFRANAYINGSTQGATSFGPGNWIGEMPALGDVDGATPDWTDDASATGTGLGDGDYSPGVSTTLPVIPAGLSPYSHDLMGVAIPDDGTAHVGAQQ